MPGIGKYEGEGTFTMRRGAAPKYRDLGSSPVEQEEVIALGGTQDVATTEAAEKASELASAATYKTPVKDTDAVHTKRLLYTGSKGSKYVTSHKGGSKHGDPNSDSTGEYATSPNTMKSPIKDTSADDAKKTTSRYLGPDQDYWAKHDKAHAEGKDPHAS